MAYAEVAGLPPVAGLWAAVAAARSCTPCSARSRQLSVGPESTTALMTAAAIGAAGRRRPGPVRRAGRRARAGGRRICLLGRWRGSGSSPTCCRGPVLVGYLAGVAVHHDLGPARQGDRRRPSTATRPSAEAASFARGLDQVHLATVAARRGRAGASCWSAQPAVPARADPADRGAAGGRGRRAARLEALGIARRHGPRRPAGARAARGDARRPASSCCCRPSASPSSATPTTCSPAAPSPPATSSTSTPTRSCSRWARPTSPPALLQGFPVSSSGSRTVIGDSLGSRSQLHSLVALAPWSLAGAARCGPCWRRSRPRRSARWWSTPRSA